MNKCDDAPLSIDSRRLRQRQDRLGLVYSHSRWWPFLQPYIQIYIFVTLEYFARVIGILNDGIIHSFFFLSGLPHICWMNDFINFFYYYQSSISTSWIIEKSQITKILLFIFFKFIFIFLISNNSLYFIAINFSYSFVSIELLSLMKLWSLSFLTIVTLKKNKKSHFSWDKRDVYNVYIYMYILSCW